MAYFIRELAGHGVTRVTLRGDGDEIVIFELHGGNERAVVLELQESLHAGRMYATLDEFVTSVRNHGALPRKTR